MSRTRRIWIPQVVVIVMMLWALWPGNPYAYYILLRWISCPIFVFLAIQASESDNEGLSWILGVTALIYNPILPVHLTREIWTVINIITICIASGSIYFLIVPDHTAKLKNSVSKNQTLSSQGDKVQKHPRTVKELSRRPPELDKGSHIPLSKSIYKKNKYNKPPSIDNSKVRNYICNRCGYNYERSKYRFCPKCGH